MSGGSGSGARNGVLGFASHRSESGRDAILMGVGFHGGLDGTSSTIKGSNGIRGENATYGAESIQVTGN